MFFLGVVINSPLNKPQVLETCFEGRNVVSSNKYFPEVIVEILVHGFKQRNKHVKLIDTLKFSSGFVSICQLQLCIII